jgi:hypothetical protein
MFISLDIMRRYDICHAPYVTNPLFNMAQVGMVVLSASLIRQLKRRLELGHRSSPDLPCHQTTKTDAPLPATPGLPLAPFPRLVGGRLLPY